ncbi:MAG TPA: cyclase family protein [Patescibacteria group bacterium]|jgi:arylformamidase|nr:cyclase family protein [Patescibacteria group bacterium]
MNIIDISWPLSSEMTTYKNRCDVQINQTKSIAKDHVAESTLQMHAHTGTHVDAPAHFIEGGKTIDQIPLDFLCGPTLVIDCTHIKEAIIAQDLQLHESLLKKNKRILLKTKNSLCAPTDQFKYDFVYLEKTGAQFLVDCGIKTVGIDYLGIERNQPNHPTHTLFLQKGIIIEGLRLAQVSAGIYNLVCLPLLIQNADGSPARAVLFKT